LSDRIPESQFQTVSELREIQVQLKSSAHAPRANARKRDTFNMTVKADNNTIDTTIQIRQHPPIG
jgi:hypothetical protein